MKNPFKSFDSFFIDLINQKMRCRFSNFLFYYITNLGGVFSLVSFVLILLIINITRNLGIEVMLSLIVSTIVVQILKRTFARNRPYWILENLNTYGIDLSDYSFPSGHSAGSFSVAIIIALNFKELGLLFLTLALLVAISRIYLAVHYPTDVVAGILIGIISGFIVHYKLYPLAMTYLENNFILGGIWLW